MNERFRVVVRWAATILIGVSAGGLAALLGAGTIVMLAGAVVLFGCAVFVGASVWASYVPIVTHPRRPPDGGEIEDQNDLSGPGLFRAVSLGFLGAGVCVGALTVVGVPAVAIAGVTGLIVLVLSARIERPEGR